MISPNNIIQLNSNSQERENLVLKVYWSSGEKGTQYKEFD